MATSATLAAFTMVTRHGRRKLTASPPAAPDAPSPAVDKAVNPPLAPTSPALTAPLTPPTSSASTSPLAPTPPPAPKPRDSRPKKSPWWTKSNLRPLTPAERAQAGVTPELAQKYSWMDLTASTYNYQDGPQPLSLNLDLGPAALGASERARRLGMPDVSLAKLGMGYWLKPAEEGMGKRKREGGDVDGSGKKGRRSSSGKKSVKAWKDEREEEALEREEAWHRRRAELHAETAKLTESYTLDAPSLRDIELPRVVGKFTVQPIEAVPSAPVAASAPVAPSLARRSQRSRRPAQRPVVD